MYRVLVQLDDGEFIVVASRDEIEDAVQLIEGLSAHWPREYIVRDAKGNEVDLAKYTAIEHEGCAVSTIS